MNRQPLERELMIDLALVFVLAVVGMFVPQAVPLLVAFGVLALVRAMLVAAERVVAGLARLHEDASSGSDGS